MHILARSLLCSSLLTFCFFLYAATESNPLFFGKDERVKIAETDLWPWQAIGQLETASGNLCTATLISPHLALTAGHCVLVPPKNLDKAVVLRFVANNRGWQYQTENIETWVDKHLVEKLKADGEGWIVPATAAADDFAFIRLKDNTMLPLKSVPLWQGDHEALTKALKQAKQRVSQAGYPEDHLNELYSHQDCKITGWALPGVLSHQCDTLPGDSGSPLLLKTAEGWRVIAIQSSAPKAQERQNDDNRALAVTAIHSVLSRLTRK